MDFPSHVSEVSDICADLTDCVSDTIIEENESTFDKFIKTSVKDTFSAIFSSIEVTNTECSIQSPILVFINIAFIWRFKLYRMVFKMDKLGANRWASRFEPFLCSPQPVFDSDINWIRYAYVVFEPAFYDFETMLKNWFMNKGAYIDHSNMISSLNFQYS